MTTLIRCRQDWCLEMLSHVSKRNCLKWVPSERPFHHVSHLFSCHHRQNKLNGQVDFCCHTAYCRRPRAFSAKGPAFSSYYGSILMIAAIFVSILILGSVSGSGLAKAHRVTRTNSLIQSLFKPPKCPSHSPSPKPSSTLRYNHLDELTSRANNLLSLHNDSLAALRLFRLAGILGDSGALTSAASLLLVGDKQVARDCETAVRYLTIAAKSGNPDAHAILGFLHASGLAENYGVVKSEPMALLYWSVAAASNNVYSSMALGFRHSLGLGVKRSCSLAARYYKRAARAVATDERFWPSASNFVYGKPPLPSGLMETPLSRLTEDSLRGSHGTPGDQDLVHFFRHSAERGDAVSRTTLGALYYFGGHGIVPNETKAKHHLKQAAEAMNEEAHAMLGHLDMQAKNNQSAFEHFMRATGKDNNKFGHYALGMVYRHGLLGVMQSHTRAAMHFQLALDDGKDHAGASFQLGLMYLHGYGVNRDIGEAFEHFKQGAKHGNIQSMLRVGIALIDGSSPSNAVHCDQGVKLLKAVAADGDWKFSLETAMEQVGRRDWYSSFYRYVLAAHAGIELGQYNAAFLLEHLNTSHIPELSHWSRRRMIEEADGLYELSALQGQSDSLIRSANIMMTELKDYNLALRTLVKAAQLRNTEGMVSLALMLGRGLGVEQDRDVAIMYLRSAKQQDPDAFIPAEVALTLLRLQWVFEDILRWMRGSQFKRRKMRTSEFEKDRNYSNKWMRMVDDFALLGALSVALLAVLILRTKRLARL